MPSTVAARHDPAIVASGADAETWLDIAQTYRGSSRAHVAWGMRMGARGRWATRSRAGVHGSFCSPAAVSRYPGAVVAGSARTRSTRADPAISGVSSSPSCFRYASSGLAAPSRVCPNPQPAHVSEWSHAGHHRRDGNIQPGTARLILGVARDEPLGGLGPGVPSAGR